MFRPGPSRFPLPPDIPAFIGGPALSAPYPLLTLGRAS
jgi:hypothetical protein